MMPRIVIEDVWKYMCQLIKIPVNYVVSCEHFSCSYKNFGIIIYYRVGVKRNNNVYNLFRTTGSKLLAIIKERTFN
jgi:hypothetical protein